MSKIKELVKKHWDVISYLFFGVCTTIVNWVSYFLLYNVLHVSNVICTIIAWVLAVAFAFITNKLWVFNSKSFARKVLFHEIWTFLTARILTGLIDVLIMFLAVDVGGMNDTFWSTFWKIISNVIIVVLNYVFSKLIIFRKKDDAKKSDEKDEKNSGNAI